MTQINDFEFREMNLTLHKAMSYVTKNMNEF